MECISTEKLYSYLDGELDEEQQIEAHLSSCKRCFSLAKRLEFESAVVAKMLRSEKVSREERYRTIKTLAEKRDWELREPLLFKYRSFFALCPKIAVILVLLLGMSVISYSVLMKDARIEVSAPFSFLSGDVNTEKFFSSASQVIVVASKTIGSMVPIKIALVFLICYIYLAGTLLFLLSTDVPVLKANQLSAELGE